MPAIAATPPLPGLFELLPVKGGGEGGDLFAPVLAALLVPAGKGAPGAALPQSDPLPAELSPPGAPSDRHSPAAVGAGPRPVSTPDPLRPGAAEPAMSGTPLPPDGTILLPAAPEAPAKSVRRVPVMASDAPVTATRVSRFVPAPAPDGEAGPIGPPRPVSSSPERPARFKGRSGEIVTPTEPAAKRADRHASADASPELDVAAPVLAVAVAQPPPPADQPLPATVAMAAPAKAETPPLAPSAAPARAATVDDATLAQPSSGGRRSDPLPVAGRSDAAVSPARAAEPQPHVPPAPAPHLSAEAAPAAQSPGIAPADALVIREVVTRFEPTAVTTALATPPSLAPAAGRNVANPPQKVGEPIVPVAIPAPLRAVAEALAATGRTARAAPTAPATVTSAPVLAPITAAASRTSPPLASLTLVAPAPTAAPVVTATVTQSVDAPPPTTRVDAVAVAAVLPALQAFGDALHRAATAERRPGVRAEETVVFGPAPLSTPLLATLVPSAAPVYTTRAHWPEAMIARIDGLRDTANAADTRIRLHPDALGSVEVAVRREADAVHVHFTAAEPVTARLLADAQPRLAELAEARGLRLTQAGVDSGASGQSDRRQPAPEPSRTPRRAPSSPADDTAADDRLA